MMGFIVLTVIMLLSCFCI